MKEKQKKAAINFMSSCRNERQQGETTTNWVEEWHNDAAGGTVLSVCAKIDSVPVFGKKYANDNLLSVRKLKDSQQFCPSRIVERIANSFVQNSLMKI